MKTNAGRRIAARVHFLAVRLSLDAAGAGALGAVLRLPGALLGQVRERAEVDDLRRS